MKKYGREKKYILVTRDKLLFLLLAIFSVKGVFYAAYAMPLNLNSSPDDVGHVSYVMYLATEHDTPILNQTRFERTAFANFKDGSDRIPEGKIYNVNTEKYEESGGVNWIAQHPPFYYLYLLPFYLITTLFTKNLASILLVLRLANIPLGAATIFFLYRSMKLLGLEDFAVKCVMVCVVFSSVVQYYLVTIDNDAMVICLSTAAFYFFVKWMKESDVKALYIFAAICGGITICKYTGSIVLPVYALVYLWDIIFIKKRSFKEFFRYSAICILIFAVITVPVLVKNYIRYATLLPIYGDTSRIYDYSLTTFVTRSGYFNEIVSHITYLTGWAHQVRANNLERYLVSLIVFCVYFFKNKGKKWLWFVLVQIMIILSAITDMNVVTALIISTVLCIFVDALFGCRRGAMAFDREVCILGVSMILFYAAAFFIEHYKAFLNRGHTGAMNGRYYYPLIAPFFFLLFRKLNENKFIVGFPFALLLVNVGMEIDLILRGIQAW